MMDSASRHRIVSLPALCCDRDVVVCAGGLCLQTARPSALARRRRVWRRPLLPLSPQQPCSRCHTMCLCITNDAVDGHVLFLTCNGRSGSKVRVVYMGSEDERCKQLHHLQPRWSKMMPKHPEQRRSLDGPGQHILCSHSLFCCAWQEPVEVLQQRVLGAQLRVTRQHFAAALQSAVPCSLRAVALPEVRFLGC